MNTLAKLAGCITVWLISLQSMAQVTTGNITGLVKTTTGERMVGAVVKVIYEPMGSAFFTQSNRVGIFYMENLHPGGPYSVEVSFLNYTTAKKTGIYINLGETAQADMVLEPRYTQLQQVTVQGTRKGIPGNNNYAVIIDRDKLDALPSVGRNLNDYLVTTPQAKTVSGNEGAISFAGQNNRYNAFYVDGAVNNDVFGLAASGTNGGQAGISPLSVDAIEQLQVAVTPYDVSIGNFTGAGINAVTRSGTNKFQSSIYHYFNNSALAGNIFSSANQKPTFFRRTYGIRTQGPITRNRLFYFINMEIQREKHSQPFAFNEYRGNTQDPKLLNILANSLRSNYGYDPGECMNTREQVFADRIVTRLDWIINPRHNLSISGRYMNGQRISSNMSDAETIHFSHNGYLLLTRNWSGSVEWKSRIGNKTGHRLLLTYTNVTDDRGPSGKPFPRVRIYDGNGSIVLGTDISSTINLLTQQNWSAVDNWYFISGKHHYRIGIEAEYNHTYNSFIQNAFGSYTYGSPGDFLAYNAPSGYQLGFSLIDSVQGDRINAAARIRFLRTAIFIQDEYRATPALSFQFGLRLDKQLFLSKPVASAYVNDTAISAFEKYHDVQGARSGNTVTIPATISPRIGFTYQAPAGNTILRGGIGIFSGRMPLAWPGGVYQYNGLFTAGYQAIPVQLNKIRFRPDPYRQWQPAEINAAINNEPLNLIASKLYMPSLIRASLLIEKILRNSLTINIEAVISKNLKEIAYTNINLLPPLQQLTGPDIRFVYTDTNQAKIPMKADGSNPYAYAILLGNHASGTGYAYNFSISLKKQIDDRWRWELNYHYGLSTVLHDGTNSVNVSQWRAVETVNGRNTVSRSYSDFSSGHRLFAWLSRKFQYARRKYATTVSISYNGQSGYPFSYVYGGSSMVRDDGRLGGYDLLYIPTAADLDAMQFIPNTVANIVFTPEQQKLALEEYISQNNYLKNRRGQYAERNGSLTPFTHIVNLKLNQHIQFKINKIIYHLNINIDIFNFGNFLNRDWGHQFVQPFDKMELIEFAGYATNNGTLLPQYRFDPFLLQSPRNPASRSNSPAYAPFWNCQLGIRFTF